MTEGKRKTNQGGGETVPLFSVNSFSCLPHRQLDRMGAEIWLRQSPFSWQGRVCSWSHKQADGSISSAEKH
jgi:hypothetical protein